MGIKENRMKQISTILNIETKYKDEITDAFKISIKSERNDKLGEIKNSDCCTISDLDEFELGKVFSI